jgi:hypothetical protein
MTPLRLAMVGLHDSGKTTYVAAAFHTLKVAARETLSLRELPEDREYLLDLEERWLNLEPVGHSARGAPRAIELPLQSSTLGEVELTIPDVSGEHFDHAWESGEWDPEVLELVKAAAGIMLFVRANDVASPRLIEVGGHKPDEAQGGKRPWSPVMAPTQAKLVDLVEQIWELRGGVLPRLAVVIAAWDTVPEIEPDDWLEWRVPLLAQWLTANTPEVEWRAFGVTAQGGELDAEGVERLQHQDRVERTGGPDKLLAPLEWLLSGP